MKLGYKIRSLSQAIDRAEFIQTFSLIQDQIRKDPYRVGLLPVAQQQLFLQMHSSLPSEFWTLHQSSPSECGRMAAYLSSSYPQVGYIGFFEAENFSIAQALIENAIKWLKTQGVKKIYGPINWNTWFSYRFRVQEDSSQAFRFEPVNPPEYPIWFQELGFQIIETYHTDGLDGIQGIADETKNDYQKAISCGYQIRTLDSTVPLEQELQILYEISLPAFQFNFLFEPIPFDFFKKLYVPLFQSADPKLLLFICNPKGKPLGYFFSFIEFDYLVLKTTAIHPEARGLGLSNAMLHAAVNEAMKKGVKKSIAALMKTGIQSESYSRKQNILWRHEYGLFEKNI